MTNLLSPLRSLKEGNWFKLICGASFQHLPAVRSLTLAYALAGADCVDVACDPAVIAVAQEALKVASGLAIEAQKRGYPSSGQLPLLMVSLNDGEDPHFRKAQFDSTQCPSDCSRPCEYICPTQAIVFNQPNNQKNFSGVITNKCYGCGRCIPICPYAIIYTSSYVSTPGAVAPLVLSTGVDALEIHTRIGSLTEFQRLWQAISPWVEHLKVLAISCPDGDGLIEYLSRIYNIISPLPCALIWQTDGRPMSGDIGDGTTNASVKLGAKVLAARLPGYVQLAGGTNGYTVEKLRSVGLINDFGFSIFDFGLFESKSQIPNPKSKISGVAYGSYARVLLSPVLERLENNQEVSHSGVPTTTRLEDEPELLWQAVELAHSLVSQLKSQ